MSPQTKIASLFFAALCSTQLVAGSVAQAQPKPASVVAGPAMGVIDGLLLLKNGETLAGRISRSGDYYLIITPTAEVQVRTRDVEAICRDLEEVFAKKLALVNTRSADSFLVLAQWCIDRQLYGHAARMLTEAIRLDDLHPRIALLERRMQAAMAAPRETVAPPKAVEPRFKDEELDRSTKSISTESLHEFTVRVQPLLMNYCATAGCHGPRPASTFQLERVYLNERSDPRTVRMNLHAVLKQVDRVQPTKSPLLTVPVIAHGGAKKPIFTAHNVEHYRQLAGWIGRLAPQRQTAPMPTSADVAGAANTLQQRMPIAPPSASAAPASPVGGELQAAVTLNAATSGSPAGNAAPPSPAPLSPAPVSSIPSAPLTTPGLDPFDPEVFNRQRAAEKK